MSHIHIPDGIISAAWWIPGYILTFAIIFIILKKLDVEEARRKIPFIGISAAIMLIGMSVPIFIVPVHLSLAVLTGILVGPKLGFLAVFVVSSVLALFGHGGITIIGINTLVIGSEVFVGSCLFRFLSRKISKEASTVVAAIAALIVSISLMIGVVSANAGIGEALPNHHHEEHHSHHEEHHSEEDYDSDEYNDGDYHHGELHDEVSEIKYLVFSGWTAVFLIFLVGIALESIGTTLIVKYFIKVRPDLITPAQNV